MEFQPFNFGAITIDGVTYDHDVVIDGGRIRKRPKKASKPWRSGFGHTRLSVHEDIPGNCRRLVVGTGQAGDLPVMEEVRQEAERRGVQLLTLPTVQAIEVLGKGSRDTNAVLHVTC